MSQDKLQRLSPGAQALAAGAALFAVPFSTLLAADLNLPPISVGAGIRTSFSSVDVDGADENIDDFNLNSARVYISGKATENISVMFNTEYNPDGDGDR